MEIVNIVVIALLLFGVYLGYQRGLLKELTDFLILFLSSLLSGKLSDILVGLLYKYIPFLNFNGKSEGLKSINIIFWKLVLYLLLLVVIIFIFNKIINKTKLSSKILDSMVETNLINKVLGALVSVPLILTFIFNISLILSSPNFNFVSLNNSKLVYVIMTKTPVLSRENMNLYANERYVIKRINEEDNTILNYKNVNDDIIKYMLKTKLIDDDKMKDLEKLNKLLGIRKEKDSNNVNNESNDDTENLNSSSKEEDSYNNDSEEYDSNETDDSSSYEESDYESSGDVYEDDSEDAEIEEDEDDIDYCDQFPGDC